MTTKLHFTIDIAAPREKIWQILWDDVTYRQWTSPFMEGSYAISDWKEGSKIQFLAPDGGGIYSIIERLNPPEYMSFKHLGEIKGGKEQPNEDGTNLWNNAMENYTLKEHNGVTTLEVDLDGANEYVSYFQGAFPKALSLVKSLSEH